MFEYNIRCISRHELVFVFMIYVIYSYYLVLPTYWQHSRAEVHITPSSWEQLCERLVNLHNSSQTTADRKDKIFRKPAKKVAECVIYIPIWQQCARRHPGRGSAHQASRAAVSPEPSWCVLHRSSALHCHTTHATVSTYPSRHLHWALYAHILAPSGLCDIQRTICVDKSTILWRECRNCE